MPSTTDKYPQGTDRFKWDGKCDIQGDDPICTGCSMNYMNRQLNDDNSIKPQRFIDAYAEYEEEQGKGDGTFKGYTMEILPGYIGEYFNTHKFISFENAIANNHVVLTWIKLPDGESHSVVVVGFSKYGGSNHLIYMDSNFGELRMIKESDIEMYLLQLPVSKK